jgi:hypothetical protein
MASGPSVIVDLAGLDGVGYSGLSVLLRLPRLRKWTRRSVDEAAENGKIGPGVVPGCAAAPCRPGYSVWSPAAGLLRCRSWPEPATARARSRLASTSCAGCLPQTE